MKAVIDKIETKVALLLIGPEEIPLHLPLAYLPEGIAEGSILHLSFTVDDAATQRTLSRMEERIAKLKEKGSHR